MGTETITPFLSSFFILLREGFEAMLIAVLVFMYLDKLKAKEKIIDFFNPKKVQSFVLTNSLPQI